MKLMLELLLVGIDDIEASPFPTAMEERHISSSLAVFAKLFAAGNTKKYEI